MKHLPNLLTSSRLVLTLLMFLALATAAGGAPFLSGALTPEAQIGLNKFALICFVVSALTDFFDGWLARKLNATSLWGAILDPIADKVLVCGAVLGILAQGIQPLVVIPAGLILFREFAVSALREVSAGKGVRLPVTLLAKWKTTLQLIALAAELLVSSWAAWGLPPDPKVEEPAVWVAHGLLWLAAVVTLITGAQYWEGAHKALRSEPA